MKNFRLVSLFIFLTVSLLEGGFGVTDEEFQVSFIVYIYNRNITWRRVWCDG